MWHSASPACPVPFFLAAPQGGPQQLTRQQRELLILYQRHVGAMSDERERVQRRVDGFDWQKSPAWIQLSRMYGPKLKQDELVSIAEVLAQKLQIRLDRDARRRKIVMIKWFEENWLQIYPILHRIVLDN